MSKVITFKKSLLISFLIVSFSIFNFLRDNWERPHNYQIYILKNIAPQEFLALYDNLVKRDTMLQGLDKWKNWYANGYKVRYAYLYDIDCYVSFYTESNQEGVSIFLTGVTTNMSKHEERRSGLMYANTTTESIKVMNSFEKKILDRIWPYHKDYLQGILSWYSNFFFRNCFWIVLLNIIFVYLCYIYEKTNESVSSAPAGSDGGQGARR